MKRLFCLLLTLLLLSGCASPVVPTAPTGESALPEGEEAQLYHYLFDLGSRVEIDIQMSGYELHKMQLDYEQYRSRGSKSPIYRMADVVFTITTSSGKTLTHRIEQVGVRMKGNTSRTDFYDPNEGIHSLIHLKLSFQETFDDPDYYAEEAMVWADESAREARKDRTFAGLEKLDIKWNRCDDSTYIREHYAYEMYRANGVLAPRTNIASVDWAGLHCGIYTIYEPIDKDFLERNLPEADLGGDLYKCGWTHEGATFTHTGSIGIEDEDKGEFFVYDLKTNKKTSNHESLKNLITKLNAGVTKEQYAALIDTDHFLRYAAVSYLLGNPDDLRNNYNNFYLYFRASDGKALFIPYDYDRCLGVTKQYNPNGDGMTCDDPFSLTTAANGQKQENPVFLYSVCTGGYYVNEYADMLERIAATEWMTEEKFNSMYTLACNNYFYLTNPSKEFRNTHGYHFRFDLNKDAGFHSSDDNMSFARYIRTKTHTLSEALRYLDRDAAQKPSIPPDYYIRAEFTNWDVKDGYEMMLDEETGLYRFEVSGNKKLKLKVYSTKQQNWFGSECVSPESTVTCQTDNHTNIILPAGRYTILFDPVTQQIYIE